MDRKGKTFAIVVGTQVLVSVAAGLVGDSVFGWNPWLTGSVVFVAGMAVIVPLQILSAGDARRGERESGG